MPDTKVERAVEGRLDWLSTCRREACQAPLNGNYYLIQNDIAGCWRRYCMDCGRKIMDYNPSLDCEIVTAPVAP